MRRDKQQDLKKAHLFSEFNTVELAQIAVHSSYQVLEKNQTLFQQGQIATNFFLNIHGQIKLAFLSAQGDEKVMETINEGQSFAEAIMFLGTKQYPLNATALTPSVILCINAQCYLDVLEKSPKACFKIMGKLSYRLHWAMSEINNLSLHNGTYRLVSFLLNSMPHNDKLGNIHLPISKQILASKLAIQPETLSRILKKLAAQGLLEVDKNYINLLDIPKLQQLIQC
ncbi:Nitric oxide-responding transcriptional regulator Dnr (Crp/Fnr family) [hydrothermal vent metagenome]|uniref:Nitric oxide-responding transcriptional regulator Dnr (Crp/Fnr family) n=1 Tax=hydrothermal vent metagenome TaxID=652676 RepID=A0A1W1E118_9ZZZZ